MRLEHLAHLLVIAKDLDATRDWYADVLGLTEGPHPDFGVPVHWMYLDGQDVVHIGQAPAEEEFGAVGDKEVIALGGRPIHHVAFHATGLAEMKDHLIAKGIEFIEQQASGQDLYQLFLQDPNGVTIEINFDAIEAEEMTAAKLALRLR
ncbi:MAG: VOC family protein [Alphaproteobacteria bacterium]|jgi:catechol 2,3-dioxygenase-like lactoylglutathione lyase family enzyme|nr:VOC family protein [Alphaproteobacteria bacterium]MDP6567742.1 VOC family protein [Alphaproteobacteria bacterium]